MRTTKTRPTGPAARPTWVRAGRGARAIAEADLAGATTDAITTVARTTVSAHTTGTAVGGTRGDALAVLADFARVTAHPLRLPGRNATEMRAAGGVFFTVVAGVVALGKGGADAAQTEQTAEGRGGDGFEGLTT